MKVRLSPLSIALLLVALIGAAFVFDKSSHASLAIQAASLPTLPAIALTSPISGFTQPVSITHAGDGTGRMFVVEQTGRIRIVKNGVLLTTPFLDISSRITSGGERGLLGLAFPPAYVSRNHFYVNYTDRAGNTVIARYRRSAADPDLADFGSEQIILTINQPFVNHKGGQLAFNPRDGFLYIGMGDGGSGGDPGNRAQNPNELLGKVLRLDVETGQPSTYTIPSSNPFVNRVGFRPEIWALGLRNPWRFSFDRLTGDLFIADVGQNAFEEVNFQFAASAGGENYGWRIMEGAHCFNPSTACSILSLVFPITEYDHTQGCSVTGGYVYRGLDFPNMHGLYIYGDFCSGRIWGLRRDGGGEWQNTMLLDSSLNISTFGEDEAGNLYVAGYTGTIFQVTDTKPPAPTSTPIPSPIRTPTPTPVTTPTPVATPPPPPTPTTVQLAAASYRISEGQEQAVATVMRSGDASRAASVDYQTTDSSELVRCDAVTGRASNRCDYAESIDRLEFAAGEREKIIVISLTDDAFVEGDEMFSVRLLNVVGANLGNNRTATLTIIDNDTSSSAANPIDRAEFFTRQQYIDFLLREPEPAGFSAWTSVLNRCNGGFVGSSPECDRVAVSSAFFRSEEFQLKGFFIYRFYAATLGRRPTYAEVVEDMQRVTGRTNEEVFQKRDRFAEMWIERAEFQTRYQGFVRADEFVDAVLRTAGVTLSNRDALVADLNAGRSRAAVVRQIVESESVNQREFNPAFVAMQYFGYLRRDPDEEGYQAWLRYLNGNPTDYRMMVNGFVNSIEYRLRFGQP